MLATLCNGYVRTDSRQVRQPCRDMIAYMVLSAVLRVGPSLSKVSKMRRSCSVNRHIRQSNSSIEEKNQFVLLQAWIGGLSDLMDEIRSFMAERLSPFRLKGLRAIFMLPDYDVNEDKVCYLLLLSSLFALY